jgi:LCP family protein required for cell wall assembly
MDKLGSSPASGKSGNRTRRRVKRIAISATAALALIVVAVAVSAYAAASHLAGNVHRIPGVFQALDSAAVPSATAGSMTILVTASDTQPALRGGNGVDHASQAPAPLSGLITLVHINAGQKAGAVISIPPDTLVSVPGHQKTQIENALPLGGPSLLIQAVENLTEVRIDHYSVVDFGSLGGVISQLGGINVDLAEPTTSYGYTFHAGINRLGSAAVFAYARQPGISEDNRVLRQQNVIRAVLDGVAADNPVTHYGALNAFTKALSVDSNFSNFQLMSLATHLRSLGGSDSTFVTVPVQASGSVGGESAATLDTSLSNQLWLAIRNDSVASFARQHPDSVTPLAPR